VKAFSAILVPFLLLAELCLGQNRGTSEDQATQGPEHEVSIVEYADFQCPFCARQAPDLRKLQAEYSGKVIVAFKHFPLPFHKQAKAAHLAALAAGEQGKFWEMHDLIYRHPDHLSTEDFDRYAGDLGLNKEKYRRSLSDPAQSALIDHDISKGKALGVNATPTFVIDGHRLVGSQSYARLKQIVEAELKGQNWQTTEPVSVDIAGAPSKGAASAPVTVVEFSDFQCPFCAKATLPLQQLLEANQGKVRFVFKNFPLDIHPDSRLAHMAALAAGEQGKFWEMHDLIYARQHALKRGDLLSFAEQLHLDAAVFQNDLDSPQLEARIEADKSEGERLGVVATPTFIVNGEVISGFSSQQLLSRINSESAAEDKQPVGTVAEIPSGNLSFGPKDAALKIEWYVDLTSPLTAESAVALQKYLTTHQGKVAVEFKNFPLSTHPTAMLVHEFALAAGAQGKFWQVESLLLADPKPKDRKELEAISSQVQLDEKTLWAEVDAHKYAPLISRDLAEARLRGISGTPTFLVKGTKLDGVGGLAKLQ
jgi:protein-disulfide isomerase